MQFWRLRCPLPSTFCKLENQESQWYNSVHVQRPGNQGSAGISPRVQRPETRELWCPRIGEDEHPCSRRERKFSLPPPFCSIGVLKELDDASPHWWGWIFYTQSTESNDSLPETSSQTNPEIMFYQLSGHPLAQSSWHIKLTITTWYNNKYIWFLSLVPWHRAPKTPGISWVRGASFFFLIEV